MNFAPPKENSILDDF